MRLAHMTWPKVEQYFKENDMVILAVGSIESHGRHNPLGTDTLIPDKILDLIEEKNNNVMILPTVPYGACQSLSPFPGTIDFDIELLYNILKTIVDNMYRHGARRFVILNGHGGNIKSIDRLGLEMEKKGAIVAELNWWLMAWDINPAWKGGHGGGEETAGVMGVDPSLVDLEEIKNCGALEFHDLTDNLKTTSWTSVDFKGVTVNIPRHATTIMDNGWVGEDHPSTATEEWGKEMLQATADYIVEFLEEFKKVDLNKIDVEKLNK